MGQTWRLDDLRKSVSATREYAYFQTSGYSFKPDFVLDEVIRYMKIQNRGPALPWVAEEMMQVVEQARTNVARTIGADANDIMLNENATIGINEVACGIDWQDGDNIVFSTHEHPGNRVTWYNIAKRYGVELRYVSPPADDDEFVAALEQHIDKQTRLMSISHVSRQTGRRFPIARIVATAHEHDIPVLVDGAQSFGSIPVNVSELGCDFYTMSGHKYIMAPQGTGAFYVRPDRIDWLKLGWIGSRSQKEMDLTGEMTLRDGARRFEFGTRNWADQAGFAKALEMWESIGWDHVYAYIEQYTDRLKGALSDIPNLVLETPLPYAYSSGIVTFNLPGLDAHMVVERLLNDDRIVCSPVDAVEFGVPGIRVSAHVFNTDEETDRLIAGIRRVQSNA